MLIRGTGRTEIRFFWRRELAYFQTAGEARRVVDKALEEHEGLKHLRQVMWRAEGTEPPQDELAEQVARLLESGELIAPSAGPLDAFWRYEEACHEKTYARQFLKTLQRETLSMAEFRSLFRVPWNDFVASLRTDEEVLHGISELLKSGRLVVGIRYMPGTSFSGVGSTILKSPSQTPAPTRYGPSSPEPDKPTFSNNDGSAQAAALQEAAKKGLPFCEECARAAAAAAKGGDSAGDQT